MTRRRRGIRVCNFIGPGGVSCPELTPPGDSQCEDHKQAHRAAQRAANPRPSARALGYDRKWEKTRARFLRATGAVCWDCGARAVDVHHIDGRGPLGPLGHEWSNLMSLCKGCHSRRTRTEAVSRQGGGV